MVDGISYINILAGQSNIQRSTPTAVDGKAFSDMLTESIDKISNLQKDSDSKQVAFASGEDIEIHDVVIAMEKYSIAMDLFISVRNKVIEAYQEVMRMGV